MARKINSPERDGYVTLPNAMTAFRAVGSIGLGIGIAKGAVSPREALVGVGVLGATDAEGNAINWADKHPRIQNALRIYATKKGKDGDPVADKILAVATLFGGVVSGDVRVATAVAIVSTEIITTAATAYSLSKGVKPKVSIQGKGAMCFRVAAIMGEYAKNADIGHEDGYKNLSTGAAVGAFVLGVASCIDIVKQANNGPTDTVPIALEVPLMDVALLS
jgi:hypothetical protein